MRMRFGVLLLGMLILEIVPASPRSFADSETVAELPPDPNHDALVYAKAHGVSEEEAQRRLILQESIGKLDAALTEGEPESFAGLWIEHEPNFGVVVQYVGVEGKSILVAYLERYQMTSLAELRRAEVSLKELELDQHQLEELLKGVRFASDINVFENRVELYVDSDAVHADLVGPMASHLPDTVEVIRVPVLAESEANIYAGLYLSPRPCTSGYTVDEIDGNRVGITTAGHCNNNNLTFQGTELPFQSQKVSGSHDVQWNTTPGFVDKPWAFDGFYDSTTPYYRVITARKQRSEQTLDSFVAKYGVATGYTWGYIRSKNYRFPEVNNPNETFIRVHRSGVDLSSAGDSGAPWFSGGTAYGIHVGCATEKDGCYDAVYMAVNYTQGIGVRVRIAQ